MILLNVVFSNTMVYASSKEQSVRVKNTYPIGLVLECINHRQDAMDCQDSVENIPDIQLQQVQQQSLRVRRSLPPLSINMYRIKSTYDKTKYKTIRLVPYNRNYIFLPNYQKRQLYNLAHELEQDRICVGLSRTEFFSRLRALNFKYKILQQMLSPCGQYYMECVLRSLDDTDLNKEFLIDYDADNIENYL